MFLFAIQHGPWDYTALVLIVVFFAVFGLLFILVEKFDRPIMRFFTKLFHISEDTAGKIALAIMVLISFAVGVMASYYVAGVVNRLLG